MGHIALKKMHIWCVLTYFWKDKKYLKHITVIFQDANEMSLGKCDYRLDKVGHRYCLQV